MRKAGIKQENKNIKIVTWTGTGFLLVVLLLFFIVTLYSTNGLIAQIRLLTEHPFAVSSDISEVKTNLALMRIRTERLQSYNQPEDIEVVRVALESLYEETDILLEDVYELYLGPSEDVERLQNTYKQLKEAHHDFLEFSKLTTSTTTVIAEYEEEHLYSLYDVFEEDADRILSYVRSTQQNIFNFAEKMSRNTMMWSVIIIAATTFGLLLFQMVIRKMNQSLYQKNQQFRVLSDTIDETFLIFEKDKKVCDFVSGSSERVLGIPSELLQEDSSLIFQYMSEETAQEIQREVNEGIAVSWSKMIEYSKPQSIQQCWLQLECYRIKEAEDVKYIMTLTDRTEERRTNQALQDALESAQRANSAKKDFLSRMSHEIRTPMNAIIGMTTIAAASINDTGKVESCLEKISYSSKHLMGLLNDVLDMSRIESNRMSIHEEPFELFQFLNSFVSIIYAQATEKGLEFTEKTAGFSEHTTYLGDTLRLNQILLNLLSNAIKFTPSGGKVKLEVQCLSVRDNKAWIRFTVEDTGIGMDEQGLNNLFIPFEQANASITGKYGGTGLGMAITQNLVAMMGGYISVKSSLGEGTTFTIELPFKQSDVEIQQKKEDIPENLDVLVVDDEQDICEHTVLLLEKMKIHAEWVLSGAEAVERVVLARDGGRGFDVCFIDWKMPDMDGVETTRRIRRVVGPDTPIIIISAYDWSDIEAEARAAGVNAFIAKPMFQSSIYNVLVSVTNSSFGMPESSQLISGISLSGMNILLAEDNALNLEIAVKLLEMNGATVETARDGQEAWNCFLKNEPGHFDVILMDVQMPIMDGCEASRQIRTSNHEDAQQIPIIALTANAFEGDVAAVLAAGMNAHIGKPFDMKELCAVIKNECKKKSNEK